MPSKFVIARHEIKLTSHSLSGLMKGRLGTKRGNKERKGRRPFSFSTPVVCPLTLSSFLLVCQSICICLSTNKKDRDWRDLWIIILCSPCDREKLIGSQMGRWVCLCVWEKGLEKYIFIHLYTCIATFIFLVNASVPASRNTHVQTVCTSVSAFLYASTAHLRVFWQTLKRVFQCVYVFLISSL